LIVPEPQDVQKVEQAEDQLKPFFYDVAELPGYTIADMLGDAPDAQMYFDLFGKDLLTKTIVQTPSFAVYHETANPGERVKPHRHGTSQLTYMLRGELIYGNRRTTPGTGYFNPDTLYSWTAGDEGAEWLEIHFGSPGIFTTR
jgi:hypothetical protein